jgi:ribosomal protein S18 acetylase RimI-like enzyme
VRTVSLRPMSDEVFAAYMESHIHEYAGDRMRTDFETREEAEQVTRKQISSTIPDGTRTKNHHFYVVTDEQSGESVGKVWLNVQPDTRLAFLFHIIIHPEKRRLGYGRQTMQLVLQRARELGGRVFWLNVMGHNHEAIAFYKAIGFNTAAMHMNMLLEG